MITIPFDPYDFFGYIASGLLVVVGMDLLFGFPHVLGQDLKIVDAAVLLLAVYIAGQLVATPAKALLEDLVIGKLLSRPNENLFRSSKPRVRSLLFPGFYSPLPEVIRLRVLERAEREGVRGTGEALFLHVRYDARILANERLIAKLNSFINKYGFARNLAFTCLVVGTGLILKWRVVQDPLLMKSGSVALVAGLLLLYRYLKFFRQYSYEVFNTYAGLKEATPTAD